MSNPSNITLEEFKKWSESEVLHKEDMQLIQELIEARYTKDESLVSNDGALNKLNIMSCTCGSRSFNVHNLGNEVYCTECKAGFKTSKDFYEQENKQLRLNIESMTKDINNLKQAGIMLQEALNDMQSRLSSSKEQKEFFTRNLLCSLVSNPYYFNSDAKSVVDIAKNLSSEYFTKNSKTEED
jgi:hypothetical protein